MENHLYQGQSWPIFNQIAGNYDRLNRLLSFNLDRYWRKKAASSLPQGERLSLLDVATGTGDQIAALGKEGERFKEIVGLDMAEKMLEKARVKLENSSLR